MELNGAAELEVWQRKLQPPAPERSAIRSDGRYVPGTRGQTQLRSNKTGDLFARYPELQQRFREHASSWRFCQRQLLRFKDRMTDGFRARYSREILLLDSRSDVTLRHFLDSAREDLLQASAPLRERVRALALAVANAFGGHKSNDDLVASWQQRVQELPEPPADIALGKLMSDPAATAAGLSQRGGSGVCRHRALLLKFACDALKLAECAVVTGVVVPAGVKDVHRARKSVQVDHMWNVVRIDGRLFVVDGMFFPGELWAAEELSEVFADFVEYHRIGGQAGMLSLDVEASQLAQSLTRRAGFLPEASWLGQSLTRKAEPLPEAVEEPEWEELMKANLEQLGDVEVCERGPHGTCEGCGGELRGQRVRPSQCEHTFHVDCFLQFWESGLCPVCNTSFAQKPGLVD